MRNVGKDFSGDRLQARRGSNYDTYRLSNLPDHQTTCLIHGRKKKVKEKEREREGPGGQTLLMYARLNFHNNLNLIRSQL